MALRSLLNALARRRRFVVVTILVGVLAALQSARSAPVYEAEAALYLGDPVVNVDHEVAVREQVGSFGFTSSVLATSRPMVDEVLAATGLDREPEEVVATTSAEMVPFTRLLLIRARDSDPLVAKALANGLADTFVAELRRLEPARSEQAQEGRVPPEPAYVFQHADLPTRPNPKDTATRVLLGGAFGAAAAIAAVILVRYLDPAPRTADEVTDGVGLDVLGTIPFQPSEPWRAVRT